MGLDPSISLRGFGAPGGGEAPGAASGAGGNFLGNFANTIGALDAIQGFQARNESGRIISQSGSTADAISQIEKSPLSGYMLPQLNQLRGLQELENKVKEFEAQFTATTEAGKKIAAAPSLEDGIKSVMSDPATAARTMPLITGIRELQRTQADLTRIGVMTEGELQTQNTKVFDGALRVAATAQNPADLAAGLRGYLGSVPASIRARPEIQAGIAGLRDSISDPDPEKMKKNQIARLAGAGTTMDTVNQLLGNEPVMMAQGNQIQPGARDMLTRAVTPAGQAFGLGAPAQIIDRIPVGAISSTGEVQGAGNPLQTRSVPQSTAPAVFKSNVGDIPIGTSPALAPGKALYGANVLSPEQQELSQAEIKNVTGPGREQYTAALGAQSNISTISRAFDALADGKTTILAPGSVSETRLALTKLANLGAGLLGEKPAFDPEKVATAELLVKATNQLSNAMAKANYGGHHVAAETIAGVYRSNPQYENTVLGGKLLTMGLDATVKQLTDQHNYITAWMADPRNNGSPVGALEAFNKFAPPDKYSKAVLDEFGMNERGFVSPEAVGAAFSKGYLSENQAKGILKSQFNMSESGKKKE